MLTDLFTGIYGHTLLFRLLTQITRRAVWKRTETANIHMQAIKLGDICAGRNHSAAMNTEKDTFMYHSFKK